MSGETKVFIRIFSKIFHFERGEIEERGCQLSKNIMFLVVQQGGWSC